MSIEAAWPDTVVSTEDPTALIAVEFWSDPAVAAARLAAALGGPLPGIGAATDMEGAWRAIRVEPSVWWLCGPLADLDDTLGRVGAALAPDGAVTDLTGGFERLRIAGPDWRSVLMIGAVFDAESPDFTVNSTVGTILHHIAVRYDVVAADAVHVFVAPSYAGDLRHFLHEAATHERGRGAR